MNIWDKVRDGIDKAGKAAQDVFDEGKLRIDLYKAREQADKAAQALGYAVFRAAESGHELESTSRDQLMTALRDREAVTTRLEAEIKAAKEAESARANGGGTASSSSDGSSSGADAGTQPPPDAGSASTPPGSPGQG